MEQALQVVEAVSRGIVGVGRQRREGEQVHQAVGEQIERHRLQAAGGVAEQGVEEIAGVRDRAVGDHAAQARLAHRGEIAPDDRDERQGGDELEHRRCELCLAEHAHRGEQDAGLDDRRHVRRHRNARGFVGVGRPGVEGHDRALQEEGQDHEHDSRTRHTVVRTEPDGEGRRRHRPAGAVEERGPHQEHGRGRAAEDEVLQRRFGALRPPVGQQHQHVDRQRHQFEPEEQGQEAVGRLHQADAVERREQQRRELAVRELVARHEQHRKGQRQHHGLGDQAGRVDRELSGERRCRVAAERQAGRGDRGRGDREDGDAERGALPASGDLQAEHEHDAQQQQVLGQHRGQHGVADHGFVSGRRDVPTTCRKALAASSVLCIGSSGKRPRAKTATTISARMLFSRRPRSSSG